MGNHRPPIWLNAAKHDVSPCQSRSFLIERSLRVRVVWWGCALVQFDRHALWYFNLAMGGFLFLSQHHRKPTSQNLPWFWCFKSVGHTSPTGSLKVLGILRGCCRFPIHPLGIQLATPSGNPTWQKEIRGGKFNRQIRSPEVLKFLKCSFRNCSAVPPSTAPCFDPAAPIASASGCPLPHHNSAVASLEAARSFRVSRWAYPKIWIWHDLTFRN